MVIEATLRKDQFIRLSLLRHFQRPFFYFYALTCAGITAYVLTGRADMVLLLVAWIPFGMYMLFGIINAVLGATGTNRPYLLKTRYEFTDQGVHVSSASGTGMLGWEQVSRWAKVTDCYVLYLKVGSIIAIPGAAVPPHKQARFKSLLQEHIR